MNDVRTPRNACQDGISVDGKAEGLTDAEVDDSRLEHGENKVTANMTPEWKKVFFFRRIWKWCPINCVYSTVFQTSLKTWKLCECLQILIRYTDWIVLLMVSLPGSPIPLHFLYCTSGKKLIQCLHIICLVGHGSFLAYKYHNNWAVAVAVCCGNCQYCSTKLWWPRLCKLWTTDIWTQPGCLGWMVSITVSVAWRKTFAFFAAKQRDHVHWYALTL